MMSNSTTVNQMRVIVKLMEKHPDMATGFTARTKEDQKIFWLNLEKEANNAGPPHKSVFEWKKVWSDKKKYIRKKIFENKQIKSKTRDGPYKHEFSHLEKSVIKICAMNEPIGGFPYDEQFGLSGTRKAKLNLEEKENTFEASSQHVKVSQDNQKSSEQKVTELLLSSDDRELNESENNSTKGIPLKGKVKSNPTKTLLEDKINLPGELYDKVVTEAVLSLKHHHTELETNVKKIYHSIDGLYDQLELVLQETRRHNKLMEELKRHDLEEIQRHNAEMEKLRKHEIVKKLELKQRLLEIKEEKLRRMPKLN